MFLSGMCKAFAKRSFSVLNIGLKLKQHRGHGCAFILLPSSAVKQGHCRKKACRCFLKSSQLDNLPLSCRDKKRGLWLATLIGRDTFHGFSAYLFSVSLLSGPALKYRPHPSKTLTETHVTAESPHATTDLCAHLRETL